ncbi:uncharacterized protein [Rutidosis leptorrhynchoides]|uniref:uncharacterized protein n=1 Tax=Rutidosis leptorrhynchoides TaxID=125765 RepID=UPI003A9A6247
MEATAGVAASRGGSSLPMTMSRKEWRAVSEHHHRSAGEDAELERPKLGQSDERTIYEHRIEAADVDFCSITIDGSLDDSILQQRLHTVAREREQLQQMEVELKAQLIARAELMEMQSSFNVQLKDHANASAKLQEKLQERDQTVNELERKMEEKDRELHAIKLANEAAWAKEDLLREQDKELATFRRERDHSEVERAQNMKQIQDLQAHIQEKEQQLMELQEQHRVAHETIQYKDEQLREAQAWISRVQEMDALQSTTNHTLQAELRERTEQYNQLWLGCQRQFSEMERHHIHTIQQLQLELAGARDRSGTYTEKSRMSHISNDGAQFGQTNETNLDLNGSAATSTNAEVLPNGSVENIQSFASTDNASIQNQKEHVPVGAIAPASMLGVAAYLPNGQVTLHPYAIHQQGVVHSILPNVSQPQHGHLPSMSSASSLPQWHNQQFVSDDSQISNHNQHQPSQAHHNIMRSDAKYEHDMSVNGQVLRSDYLDARISQGTEPENEISPSTGEATKAFEAIDRGYLVNPQSEKSLQQISAQFQEALSLDSVQHVSESKENVPNSSNHGSEGQVLTSEQPSYAPIENPSDTSIYSVGLNETGTNNTPEIALLDEKTLLACIVRTIPHGGRIRISSTLPNRLGKMLAPLHWHDYKKKYGKLDEFVAHHRELFVIEGDFIQHREGAQEMVAATAAVARVAAAAAASSSPQSSNFPSVAVTPMAQSRLKILSKSRELNGANHTRTTGAPVGSRR